MGRPGAGCGLDAGFAFAVFPLAFTGAFPLAFTGAFAGAFPLAAAFPRTFAVASPLARGIAAAGAPRSPSKDASKSRSSKSKTPFATCFGAFAATS